MEKTPADLRDDAPLPDYSVPRGRFSKVLKRHKTFKDYDLALYVDGFLATEEGKFDEALQNSDASLKMRKTARGYLVRAQALQRLERVEDALASVDQAVEMSSTYAPAFELRGRILWAAGRKDEARFAFEQFLALESDTPKAEAIRDLLRENR